MFKFKISIWKKEIRKRLLQFIVNIIAEYQWLCRYNVVYYCVVWKRNYDKKTILQWTVYIRMEQYIQLFVRDNIIYIEL